MMAEFTASVRVRVYAEVPIQGDTFEEAIANAKKLKATDVVKTKTPQISLNDWEIAVSGVTDMSVEVP
jgi:hypothetical protein